MHGITFRANPDHVTQLVCLIRDELPDFRSPALSSHFLCNPATQAVLKLRPPGHTAAPPVCILSAAHLILQCNQGFGKGSKSLPPPLSIPANQTSTATSTLKWKDFENRKTYLKWQNSNITPP